MPIGKDSLKRAVSSTAKTVKAETKKAEIAEVLVSEVEYRGSKACDTLVESIKKSGVILPIAVVKDGDKLKLVDGAKRLDALKALGETKVKAYIVDGDAKKVKAELKKCNKENFLAAKTEAKETKPVDMKEEKFIAVKRLGDDDFPIYLL